MTGASGVPMVQLLPSSGLISLKITGCVQVKRRKFVIGPTSWASAKTWLSAGLAAACWQMFSTVALLLGQPSSVVRLPGIRSGLVDRIADGPASGDTVGRGKSNVTGAESYHPNCTFTGWVTGVVMLPIVIDPLFASPAVHTVTVMASC